MNDITTHDELRWVMEYLRLFAKATQLQESRNQYRWTVDQRFELAIAIGRRSIDYETYEMEQEPRNWNVTSSHGFVVESIQHFGNHHEHG